MKYYTLRYTDDLTKESRAGETCLWSIRIKPKYLEDQGILEHEKRHVLILWCFVPFGMIFGVLLYSLLIKFSKTFLKWCEIACYRRQLQFPPATTDVSYFRKIYAGFIATRYGLDLSPEEAEKLLV